jgi:hypothetical protein
VLYELSEVQKKCRVDQSGRFLDMLWLYTEQNFEGMATGDKSWFLCITDADSVFAVSAVEVVPRTNPIIYAKKTIVTIFFTSAGLLVLNCLPCSW